jgi:DNA-binding transcriptional MerR regulator
MAAELYTLTELSEAAGVTPRTVRYYVSQGLLPSPGHGPGARYGEDHLDRLRAIKRLQREHLPLAEIRHRLAPVNEADVAVPGADGLPAAGAQPMNTSAIDYIRGLLDGRGGPPPRRVAEQPSFQPLAGLTAEARPGVPLPPAASRYLAARSDSVSSQPAAGPEDRQPRRSQWDRITLNPDLELHVRRPLSRLGNRQVERLLAYARDLFEENQS